MNTNHTDIPGWMLEKENIPKSVSCKTNAAFFRKTIMGISGIVQDELMAERSAHSKGLLQALDPRVKLITILILLIFSSTSKSMLTLVFLTVIAFILVKLSNISIISYTKRVWFIIPFLLLLVSLPGATSLIIKGTPLLYIYHSVDINYLPREVYISKEGLQIIFRMAIRVGVSISFGYLLIMTTKWTQLTKSLKMLKIPYMIIAILDMTYRYIFVLARVATEMFEARFLRTVGSISNVENRSFVSKSIAALFVRSKLMSDDIYDSMVCRRYTGNPVSLYEFRFSRNDWAWIINFCVITIILLAGEFLIAK